MRRIKYLLLAGLLAVGGLTGCQKKEVHPGDVKGYEEGEEYHHNSGYIVLRTHWRGRYTERL